MPAAQAKSHENHRAGGSACFDRRSGEEGAYADLLLINGDPLKDISILAKPDENVALIMKDGKTYRNAVK